MREVMTKSMARNIFYGGSLFFILIFVGLTLQSHRYIVTTSTNTATGGGTTTNPAPGVTLNTNLVVNLRTNITLPSLQTVLLDKRVIVTDTASATVTANPAPGAGTRHGDFR